MPVGELTEYSVYEGEIAVIVSSKWQYNSQEYRQTIVLPRDSETIQVRFEVFAEKGDEIFLRFKHPEAEEDWFYTFNSADIRLRRPFPKKRSVVGEDYYPVVGGLFIKNGQEFLQFFPKFPLGVGMTGVNDFELHLHRNPPYDDVLGLGTPLSDSYPVDHEFVIRIGDLNRTAMWKDYLSHKNSHILFAVGEEEEDIEVNQNRNIERGGSWGSNTEYSLTDGNPCVYLSSLGVNNGTMFAKVLNVCENPEEFTLNSTYIMDEVLVTENPVNNKLIEIQQNGKLAFEVGSNSGEGVLQYPNGFEKGKVSPFSFNAYEIHHVCGFYHEIDSPKSVTIDGIYDKIDQSKSVTIDAMHNKIDIPKSAVDAIYEETESPKSVTVDKIKDEIDSQKSVTTEAIPVFLDKTTEYSTNDNIETLFYLIIMTFGASAIICISLYLFKRRKEKKSL